MKITTKMLLKINNCISWWRSSRRSMVDDFNEFIKEGMARMQWSEGTVKRWRTFREHITKFEKWWEKESGREEYFAYTDLDEMMLASYVHFLSVECGYRNSTVAKETKMMKWFLRWADKKGYIRVRDYLEFRPKMKTTRNTVIFLTMEELMALNNLIIPADTPQYDKMSLSRDIFCFCSFTSLRFSDAVRLKLSNIQADRIIVTTQKTNDTLSININPYARKILQRYVPRAERCGTVFPHIAMSTVNIHIKQLGEMCGIDSPVTRTWFIGRERVEETLPKWQCLSTHAARRTFICTALASGVSVETVMKWTGHSSYQSMKPYIDISDEDKARAMEKVFG